MKPLSDKFANLGGPSITRRYRPEMVAKIKAIAKEPGKPMDIKTLAVKRSRAKSTHYRDYQRDYMRKRRAKLSTP